MLAGVAAIGLFVSTLTEVPLAAMATTAILVVIIEILGAIPQISQIHPYLLTTGWLSFGDLVRDPIAYNNIVQGLLVTGAYVVVFGSMAWARFTTRDITS
jgi:ABC-2 type transport system permease protein